MTPHHHPAEEFLLQYASGAATEPFALLIATHLDYCIACRTVVAQAEAIGGALLDALEPAPAGSSSLDSDIAEILQRAARQPEARPHATPNAASPLGAYLSDLNAVGWRALGPGIQHCVLAKDNYGAVARLLRIAAGRRVFEHSHGGNELTLVLEGSYHAGGAQFRRGDVECADETVTHQPVAGLGATCICLAVTDRPLRFNNPLGRLMQRFIRI